jgi:hypothetical protein
MTPDDLRQAWQTQSTQMRLSIDADLLLKEVQRNQQQFAATIFWRDFREVGVGVVMVPLWIYLGIKLQLPWSWYLTVPAIVWIGGFILVDRMRVRRQVTEPCDPLRQGVQSSLAEVEHQIWLLRNIFWWYLLPMVPPMLAFFGHIAWLERDGGGWTVLATVLLISVVCVVFAAIYRLNLSAIRTELDPRRQELKALLLSLTDETPPAT